MAAIPDTVTPAAVKVMQSSVNRAGRYSTSQRHCRTRQRYADPLPQQLAGNTKLPGRIRGQLRAKTA